MRNDHAHAYLDFGTKYQMVSELDQRTQLVQWKPKPAGLVGYGGGGGGGGAGGGRGGGAGGGLAHHPEAHQLAMRPRLKDTAEPE